MLRKMETRWRALRYKKQLFIGLICFLTAAAAGYHYYEKNKGKASGSGQNILDYRPDYRMRIEHLQFYGMKDGRKVISLLGDSFVIEKKKLGFLTVSITHVARLDNARIDLYDTRPDRDAGGRTGNADPPSSPNVLPGHRSASPESDGGTAKRSSSAIRNAPASSPLSPLTLRPSYGAVFSAEAFNGFPVPINTISAIEVAPIKVRLFNGERLASELTAARSELRFQHRDIVCEGNVRVASGNRELTTEALVFRPDRGIMEINTPYRLNTAGKVETGGRLTTDVYLHPQKAGHHRR